MDLNLVQAFVDIVEAGNLAEAGRRRGVTRSQVSRQLAQLEEQAGTMLLRRTTRRLEMTDAGQSLYEHGLRILQEIAAARAEIDSLGKTLRGHVRVAANISAITQFLPDDLRAFLVQAPLVQVHLTERISTAIAQAVAESTADVGILHAGSYGEPLTLLPYRRDELVLIAPRDHALARRRGEPRARGTRPAGDAGLPRQLRRPGGDERLSDGHATGTDSPGS